jgi:hypothetical protein
LGKARNLVRELFCGFACVPFGNDTIAETHCQRFLSADRTTSEN